jgi:hypothetical protein
MYAAYLDPFLTAQADNNLDYTDGLYFCLQEVYPYIINAQELIAHRLKVNIKLNYNIKEKVRTCSRSPSTNHQC